MMAVSQIFVHIESAKIRPVLYSKFKIFDSSISRLAKTIVSFLLHKMFVQGKNYVVSMKGHIIHVSLSRSQNVQDINTSSITIEFPYILQKNNTGEVGHEVIKRECVDCLNRLGEIVRFKTRLYLIERIFEHDIFLFNVDTVDSTGKERTGFAFGFGGGPFFPINSIPEKDVEHEISEMLKNESSEVPFYENLRLDSFYYFSTGRFNDAVIVHNIILESIIADHLFNKLMQKGVTKDEADKRISKIFSRNRGTGEKGGIHKVMSEDFEQIDGRSFRSSNLWDKFTQARTKRKNVIHPRTTKLSKDLALKTMQDIEEIVEWIHG